MTYPNHVREMIESVDAKLEKSLRECRMCNDPKPVKEFYENDLYRDGYSTRCRACLCEYQKDRNRKVKRKRG